MAKRNTSVSFKNAIIDLKDNSIREIHKDYEEIFDLTKILSEWDGIENISLSIKKDADIPAESEE